ncbi:Cysteine transporter [Schizosaccharomyces pombe]
MTESIISSRSASISSKEGYEIRQGSTDSSSLDLEKKENAVDTTIAKPFDSDEDIADVEKAGGKKINNSLIDETFAFMQDAKKLDPLTPKQESKLKWKLYIYLLLMLGFLDMMLFIDKATLSYSTILGLFDDVHITSNQYNNLNTLFYVGYIVGQFPGHYIMQTFPLGKFVGLVTFSWSVVVFLHCCAYNYGGLIALRFFLGFTESCLLPAMEATMGMFFTHQEQAFLQPVFWISCLSCGIPAGFIAYGLEFVTKSIAPWKLFMIITGGITFFLSIFLFFYYPDNPSKARFLTDEEKLYTIDRVRKSTRGGIENKIFKKHQFIEALKDPITWLFTFAAFTLMLSNNLAYQQNLIFTSLNVSDLNSTLVGVALAGYNTVSAIIATFAMYLIPNQSAYHAMFWMLPSIAGGIAFVALPWSNRIGELATMIIASDFGITYIIALGWTTATSTGYTKKLTRGLMFMVGYAIANIISPQLWQSRDAPRYYPAWIVQIVVAWFVTPIIYLVARVILARRNKQRKELKEKKIAEGSLETIEKTYVDTVDEFGNPVKVLIDNSMLDLTDMENLNFVYPL